MTEKRYRTFSEFYPFYLSEHAHPVNRLLHVIGTGLGLGVLMGALITRQWFFIPVSFVCGYAFAWVGHFLIEKNRPATFTYPLYSFIGDWKMFFEIVTFQRGLKD